MELNETHDGMRGVYMSMWHMLTKYNCNKEFETPDVGDHPNHTAEMRVLITTVKEILNVFKGKTLLEASSLMQTEILLSFRAQILEFV